MKTITLPEAVYKDLEAVTEELALMAKKPISTGMAVYLLVEVYRAHVREPCARDAFQQKLASADLMSPEEFEKAADAPLPKVLPLKAKSKPRQKATRKQ